MGGSLVAHLSVETLKEEVNHAFDHLHRRFDRRRRVHLVDGRLGLIEQI